MLRRVTLRIWESREKDHGSQGGKNPGKVGWSLKEDQGERGLRKDHCSFRSRWHPSRGQI